MFDVYKMYLCVYEQGGVFSLTSNLIQLTERWRHVHVRSSNSISSILIKCIGGVKGQYLHVVFYLRLQRPFLSIALNQQQKIPPSYVFLLICSVL